MHKSSIYLPDDLKRSLGARAEASGRSEAELIRQAVERLLTAAEAGTAAVAPEAVAAPPRPALIGVGVGPGDPSLITRRAADLLGAADRVVVITTDPRSVGRAETVVRAVAPLARLQRVPYEIAPGGDRDTSMERLVEAVTVGLDAGEAVVVAVLGDPSQWTVFPQLAERVRALRPGAAVSAVPGVTAYQAAAAAGTLRLGDGDATLVVTADPARARRALAEGEAVVLHKATTGGEEVRALVAGAGRDDAVLAELTGSPGERRSPALDAPDGPLAYLSTVIVPHRPDARAGIGAPDGPVRAPVGDRSPCGGTGAPDGPGAAPDDHHSPGDGEGR